MGFFKGCELIAVMDLIAQYPDKETAFIGLLMVDEKFQHTGVGRAIRKHVLSGSKMGFIPRDLNNDRRFIL